MNESAGDPLRELLPNHLDLNDTDDIDATDDDTDAEEDSPVRSAREGLPTNFRMRHDAHYVDELLSRTPYGPAALDHGSRAASAVLPVAPRPERSSGPAMPAHPPAQASSSSALSLLADRLEGLVAHAGGGRADVGAPALVGASVAIEFARAARLARAAALLEGRPSPVRRSVRAGRLADRIRRASAPVARMAGLDCAVVAGDPAFVVAADPALIVQSVAGTVDAFADLLFADGRRAAIDDDDFSDVRMAIALHSEKIRPALMIDVSCPALSIDAALAERFFESPAELSRVAPAAGILLSAAAHVARAHGGRTEVKRHAAGGLTVTFVLPQAGAEQGAV